LGTSPEIAGDWAGGVPDTLTKLQESVILRIIARDHQLLSVPMRLFLARNEVVMTLQPRQSACAIYIMHPLNRQ